MRGECNRCNTNATRLRRKTGGVEKLKEMGLSNVMIKSIWAEGRDLDPEAFADLIDAKVESVQYRGDETKKVTEPLPMTVWESRGYTEAFIKANGEEAAPAADGTKMWRYTAESTSVFSGNRTQRVESSSRGCADVLRNRLTAAKAAAKARKKGTGGGIDKTAKEAAKAAAAAAAKKAKEYKATKALAKKVVGKVAPMAIAANPVSDLAVAKSINELMAKASEKLLNPTPECFSGAFINGWVEVVDALKKDLDEALTVRSEAEAQGGEDGTA